MKILDLKQRTPEWYEARRGRVGASQIASVLEISPWSSKKTQREKLMQQLIDEALGRPVKMLSGPHLDYGNQHEDRALRQYEDETFNHVYRVGYIIDEDIRIGCSPDGLVGEDGGLEIKCPYKWAPHMMRAKGVDVATFDSIHDQPHYMAQVQQSLMITGRKWWDFYQWSTTATRLERVYPDKTWFNWIETEMERFSEEFDQRFEQAKRELEAD